MAAHCGYISVELLARVGDGEPQSMGFVNVPVTVKSVNGGKLEVDVSQMINYVGEDLKAVFGKDA